MAIIEPTPETSPVVCNLLMRENRPFACLVAADLVHWVSRGLSATVDMTVQERLKETTRIVYLEANLVWSLHGIPESKDEVFSAESKDDEAWKDEVAKEKK